MKFTEVKELPKRAAKKNLQDFLEDFMAADIEIAKVDFDKSDYKHPQSCQSSMYRGIKTGGFPIIVRIINNKVYLIRTDLL